MIEQRHEERQKQSRHQVRPSQYDTIRVSSITLLSMQRINSITMKNSVTDETYGVDGEDTSDVSKGTRKAKRCASR